MSGWNWRVWNDTSIICPMEVESGKQGPQYSVGSIFHGPRTQNWLPGLEALLCNFIVVWSRASHLISLGSSLFINQITITTPAFVGKPVFPPVFLLHSHTAAHSHFWHLRSPDGWGDSHAQQSCDTSWVPINFNPILTLSPWGELQIPWEWLPPTPATSDANQK